MLSFVSPNNAVQMMVPMEALPMDPSTILESLDLIINYGYSCEDILESTDAEACWNMVTQMFGLEIKGALNKDAVRHAEQVAAAMEAPAVMVRGLGLLANLSICNATVDFESLQDIFLKNDSISLCKNTFKDFYDGMKKQGKTSMMCTILRRDGSDFLKMDREQYKDFYNDLQTILLGIAKIEATSTLGLHVCLTTKNVNYPFACE